MTVLEINLLKESAMNIVIFKDSNREMMSVEVNQKTVFYGNYWDFSAPKDLENLLHEIQKAETSVRVNIIKATIENE